jgi:CBS domain-containing protein
VVGSLVDARIDPVDVGHIVGFTIDALTRRLIGFATERFGDPPVPWAWLALGSAARQEQALHTDQDHALAYDLQGHTREEVDPYFAEFAEFVTAGLEDAGIPRCNGDAMGSLPRR